LERERRKEKNLLFDKKNPRIFLLFERNILFMLSKLSISLEKNFSLFLNSFFSSNSPFL